METTSLNDFFIVEAKGIFASVIKDGFMTMKNGLASVEIDGRLNFINAFGRLYDLAQKESIDAEKLFGTYGVGIRSKTILDKNQYDENGKLVKGQPIPLQVNSCLLYTSDAADE